MGVHFISIIIIIMIIIFFDMAGRWHGMACPQALLKYFHYLLTFFAAFEKNRGKSGERKS